MNTNDIAFIGMITGIIGTLTGLSGLIISLLKYTKEKIKLKNQFKINYILGDPPKPDHQILCISIGRLEASIVAIKYRIMIPGLNRLLSYFFYKKGLYEYEHTFSVQKKIKHGENVTIKFSLPNSIQCTDIHSIYLLDGLYRKWKVPWKGKYRNKLNIYKITEKYYENSKRIIKYVLYKGYNKYFLSLFYNGKPAWKNRETARFISTIDKRKIEMYIDKIENEFKDKFLTELVNKPKL